MIRAFYGIEQYPFSADRITLMPHQQEVADTLKIHSFQGGLCLVMGEPGTGKSIIKEHLRESADKRMMVVSICRTLHTYSNIIKILCQAFNIEYDGTHFKCEKRLIEEAYVQKRQGKMLVTIIDEAHLLDMETLRKLRLMFEDFPKNHNLILIGQSELIFKMALKVNEDIKSRVTFSVNLLKLGPDDMGKFILDELSKAGLGHNTFSEEALALIVRSCDGIIRRARNLCLSCLLEGVRDRKKTIGIDIVNRVLIQPHWRNEQDIREAA
jgi:type II secretory pathway predicted ATPase ExeA